MSSRSGDVSRQVDNRRLGFAQIRVGPYLPHIATATPILGSGNSLGAMGETKFSNAKEFFELKSGWPAQVDKIIPLSESTQMDISFKELTPLTIALAQGLDPFGDISATVMTVNSTTALGTTTGSITVDDNGGVVTDKFFVVFSDATNFDVIGEKTGHVGSGTVDAQFAPDNGGNPYFTIPANFFTGTWAANENFVFSTTAFSSGTDAYDDPKDGIIHLGAAKASEYVRVEAIYTFPTRDFHMVVIFPKASASSNMEIAGAESDESPSAVTFKANPADGDNAAWTDGPLGRIVFVDSVPT